MELKRKDRKRTKRRKMKKKEAHKDRYLASDQDLTHNFSHVLNKCTH